MKIKYIYLPLMLTVIILVQSCTKGFRELNTRPDALLTENLNGALLGQAFAQAQFSAMNANWTYEISQNLFADVFSQFFALTQPNFDSDRYVEVKDWANAAWNFPFYGSAAMQLKLVEDISQKNDLALENALAKVWKVHSYQRITDYWGPVIYSEYGNGKTTVNYDSQESIYKNFFKILDTAVAILKQNSGRSVFAKDDLIFEGNVDKWLLFANSLRLRCALRIKYVEPALARTEAEKAVADGVMTNNTHSAWLLMTASTRNPLEGITNYNTFRMSASMESILVGYQDPRLPDYFSPAVDGDSDGDGIPYEGLRNGLLKTSMTLALNNAHSHMHSKYFLPARGGVNPPLRVMSAAEVYFLRAEGALEGWNMGGSEKSLYESGVSSSLSEVPGVGQSQINAYISSTNLPKPVGDAWGTPALTDIPVAFDEAGNKERRLEQIITQKWISLYPNGWEAWAELRRTGYPKLYERLASDNPDVPANGIIRRLTFVSGEFASNAAATQAAANIPELKNRGGDKNSTRVWWDAK